MSKVKSVRSVGNAPVYNMTVSQFHNFMIQGNVVVKNCDALRGFCVWWVVKPNAPKKPKKRWSDDLIEDYRNASTKMKAKMVEIFGEPQL